MQPLSPEVRAAVLALMADEIADRLATERAAAADGRLEGDRVGVALPGPDGRPVRIGTITIPKPSTTVDVDEAALVKWAEQHMPHEVVTIKQVRDATRRKLVDEVKKYGGVVDPATGEVTPVPWATLAEKPGAPRVDRPGTRGSVQRDQAWAVVLAAVARGELNLGEIVRPEIGPGDHT